MGWDLNVPLRRRRLPKCQELVLCLESWKCFLNYEVFQNSRFCKSITQSLPWQRELKIESHIHPRGIQISKVQSVHSEASLPLMGLSLPQTMPFGRCNPPVKDLGHNPLGTLIRNNCNLFLSLELKHIPLRWYRSNASSVYLNFEIIEKHKENKYYL